MGPRRGVALSVAVLAMAVSSATAAPWVLEDGPDPFSDKRVVQAAVANEGGDALSITCDENLALVTVFAPAREIRAEELAVRYRVDDNVAVESGLAWEGFNGRARAVLVSTTSLFGDRSQVEQVDEFSEFGAQLIAGARLVIEAGGERATFGLARSGSALEAVFAACEITLEVGAE